ncbi:hypothetical protein TIFTF001_022774 [Ficus carica]|uniref:Uncharacterized protein n=1 Tax=Ficus carica TaxID=3494 RepID=A0AA88DK21_FICCA|nr:hypothetical protein TIFTF001_022774 [Ficus carica]
MPDPSKNSDMLVGRWRSPALVPSKEQLKAIAPLAVSSDCKFLSRSAKHNYRIESRAASGA